MRGPEGEYSRWLSASQQTGLGGERLAALELLSDSRKRRTFS